MNSSKPVLVTSVFLAALVCGLVTFYKFFTITFSETGWAKDSSKAVSYVIPDKFYFKLPNEQLDFYPAVNFVENVVVEDTKENGERVRAKVSIHYTYNASQITLSPDGYADLVSMLIQASAKDAIYYSTSETELVLKFSESLYKYTQRTGIKINSSLISSIEKVSDPVADMNHRKRASRRLAMEASNDRR